MNLLCRLKKIIEKKYLKYRQKKRAQMFKTLAISNSIARQRKALDDVVDRLDANQRDERIKNIDMSKIAEKSEQLIRSIMVPVDRDK